MKLWKTLLVVGGVVTGAAILRAATRQRCVFLFVSDTHNRPSEALIAGLLSESKAIAVIHGGDIADTTDHWRGAYDRPFEPVLEVLPVEAVSGNHDVDAAANEIEFERRFGELPRRISCGGLVDVYLVPWGSGSAVAAWLEQETAASEAKYRILVTHKPVWSRDGDRLARLFAASLPRIDLVLAGHEHVSWDSTHEVGGHAVRQVIEVSGPKKYACPDSWSGCVAGSTGYLRVEVNGSGISVRRREVTP